MTPEFAAAAAGVAGAIGRLAKTEAIDAVATDHFAQPSVPNPSPDTLLRLLARGRQLVVLINAESSALPKLKLALRSCKTLLRSPEAERERIDRA